MVNDVEVLIPCAYPEMADMARLIWSRQESQFSIFLKDEPGNARGRWDTLARMVEMVDAEFFMLGDDDDYVAPGYVAHCRAKIGSAVLYGEIPSRTYLLRGPAYGEGCGRTKLFSTFTLFRTKALRERVLAALRSDKPGGGLKPILEQQWRPPHSRQLTIMRGLMDEPGQAITTRKNSDSEEVWPLRDEGHKKLRQWVDAEMFAYLMGFAEERQWV